MENTARKLSAEQIIKEANDAHGSLDLLRVFLITNSADIIREYEFFSKLLKNNPSDADRAIYNKALKTLVNVSLKRIELTDAIYKANESTNAISVEEVENANEPEAKSIMMLPSLDDIVGRVRTLMKDGNNTVKSHNEAFELLKTTVGQGKVLNADGKPETWDNAQIQAFIQDNSKVEEPVKEIKPGEKFGFETIHGHFMTMVEAGKKEPEIKESLKSFLMGKIISGKDTTSDYLIKDDAVFEDYYSRILSNIINITITAYENKAKEPKPGGKFEDADKKMVEEISPILEEQDKDETISSFAGVTKKAKEIYASFGFKKSLSDTLLRVQEIAEKVAPNLLTRNKATGKSNMPTVETEKQAVEIFDESYNIKETNKELWAEVEKYEYLDQIFKRAVELSMAGFWKDALSMTIILISSGKIKETETSEEPIKWDVDQTKLWYHSNVEIAVTKQQNEAKEKTEDVKAEVVDEKKEDIVQQKAEETAKPAEDAKQEEKKFGPVPQAGTIESNENISRLLKEPTLWKDTYSFKSFILKTDHHNASSMALEVVDATEEQEKDLLVTEINMTKFFDGLTQQLVARRNDEPLIRKTVMERLSPFYELTGSEVKRIVGGLVKEADAIRRELKKSQKASNKVADTKKEETPEEEKPEVPEVKKEEEVASPPAQESVEQKVESEIPQSTESSEEVNNPDGTEQPAGEEHTNSNNEESSENSEDNSAEQSEEVSNEKVSYDGFENIVTARKKYDFDVAIHKKISEYETSEEGIKAVFDIVNVARKDNHFKKSFIRNHKGANPVDLLSTIHKIYTTGVELTKKQ